MSKGTQDFKVVTRQGQKYSFIKMFYNPKKRHTGGVSPVKFEETWFTQQRNV